MLLIFLVLVLTEPYQVISQPASCTEDTQCSAGFYCEESVHICRECLRCSDYKREAPQPWEICVKTVMQCGACVTDHDQQNSECVSGGAEGSAAHAYLPSYAWVALAAGLLIVIVMLGVFLKMKTFKVIDYSSQTSVQSIRADDAASCPPLAPPPYNCVLPSTFPPSSIYADAPEIQRLVESPKPCLRPSAERPREASASQAARVFNHPAYVRVPHSPQTPARLTTGGLISSEVEGDVIQSSSIASASTASDNMKIAHNFNPVNISGSEPNYQDTNEMEKNQDSNNNRSSQRGENSHEGHGPASYVIGGPSFVINVVEAVTSVHQHNENTFCRSDSQ